MGKDFYHQMNLLTKDTDNSLFVSELNQLIKPYLDSQTNRKNMLVIGAGNLNDFSIGFYLKYYNKMTLSDIDIDGMLSKAKEDHRISIKKIDYLGMDQLSFYNSMDMFLNINEFDEIKNMLNIELSKIKDYHFSDAFDDVFDGVYVSPIYTQLLYRELESKLTLLLAKGLSEDIYDFILKNILQEMPGIIDHFNQEINRLLSDKGIVIVASDILMLTDNALSKTIKEAIHNDEKMNQLYLSYRNQYGFGLGDYGLYSLSQSLIQLKEKWILWHQSKYETYAVKVVIYKRSK
jgi:hypothetical protein